MEQWKSTTQRRKAPGAVTQTAIPAATVATLGSPSLDLLPLVADFRVGTQSQRLQQIGRGARLSSHNLDEEVT